ncbi:MAG: GntR family transcriptional regulator, partial [Pseudomonadota bacterium]
MSKAKEKAYSRIRAGIVSGELAPGQHLKEEELAELCDVSRTPVREALRQLESDDFVERRDNQRVFVANWTDAEIDDVFVLRAMLEGYAAGRAAQSISADALAALTTHHQAIVDAVGPNGRIDHDVFMQHNRAFHNIIIEAAGSQRLAIMLQRLVEQPVVLRTLVSYSARDLHRSIEQHAEIIDALEAGDAVWATAAITGHIHHAQRVFHRAQAADASQIAA